MVDHDLSRHRIRTTYVRMIPGTHNQSQSIQTQIIKSLFSIQICSINLTLGTVKV